MQFLQLNHYKIASYDAIILLQNRLKFRLTNAIENLKNKTSNNEKFKQYFQFLGINPDNLDVDQVAEDIKNVNGK